MVPSKIKEFSLYNKNAQPASDDGLTEQSLVHLMWRNAVVNFARLAWIDGYMQYADTYFEILQRDYPVLVGGAAGRDVSFMDIFGDKKVVDLSYQVGVKDQLFMHPNVVRSKIKPRDDRSFKSMDSLRREPVFAATSIQAQSVMEVNRLPRSEPTSVTFQPSTSQLHLIKDVITNMEPLRIRDWLIALALSTLHNYLKAENYRIDTARTGELMENLHTQIGQRIEHNRSSVMFLKIGETGHDMDTLMELLEGEDKMPLIQLDVVLGSCTVDNRLGCEVLRTPNLIFKQRTRKTFSVAETVALVQFFYLHPVSPSVDRTYSPRTLSCFSSRIRNVSGLPRIRTSVVILTKFSTMRLISQSPKPVKLTQQSLRLSLLYIYTLQLPTFAGSKKKPASIPSSSKRFPSNLFSQRVTTPVIRSKIMILSVGVGYYALIALK